ncbi:hypothetical protein L198_07858 [Cryptococcus wingfieldii CBS 7118]|uniref:Uncharacterized protein n=1 Tax=Cryptococcus wingfieldii CBS 7118 TaxID=1295528 RepID=A0A1E3HXA9_9TREE|nr:hypothetical protein L198_07858 [Cryptococcus wingfieldii CBS 7118]ODN80201.1 hypothetical protein L198_07858 [Cryptococcus wingfieldii CBS 7118]
MGQANGRMTDSEASLQASSVTSLPPTPMPEHPEFHHAPHSAPILSTNAFSNMPKALHRSLSKSRRVTPPKSKGHDQASPPVPSVPAIGSSGKSLKMLGRLGVDEELKAFEALVLQAEARAGIAQPQARSMKRHSKCTTVPSVFSHHTPAASLSTTALKLTPPHLRPALYRRNSTSSSIHSSSRGSFKSARRAEREWRAKVAAISSGFGPGNSPSKERAKSSPLARGGPVPPRRTNTPGKMAVPRPFGTRSDSSPPPTAATLLTPLSSSIPSPSPNDSLTPFPSAIHDRSVAKSIQGRKSFETLGHYLHVPEGRDRQASVPNSVSVKENDEHAEEEDGEGERERQLSVAASTLLALEGAGRRIAEAREGDVKELYVFQLEKPKSEVEEKDVEEKDVEGSVTQHEPLKRAISPTSSIPSLPTSFSASPSASAATSPNPTISPLPSLSLPAETDSHTAMIDEPQTPLTSTGLSPASPSSPPTPYSPATAYILSAPMESLGWNEAMLSAPVASALASSAPVGKTSFSELGDIRECEELPVTPATAGHPYTFGKQDSPLAPTPPRKDTIPRLWESGTPTQRTFPSRSVPAPTSLGASGAFSESEKGSTAVVYPRKKPAASTSAAPASRALQPRFAQATVPSSTPSSSRPAPSSSSSCRTGLTPAQKVKMEAMGSRHAPPPGGKGMKRVVGGIDLTPGMGVDGKRPGKSGLPRSDLERWLQGTAGACSA